MNNHPSKYPLLPFSQLVYDITRWMPSLYRFPVVLRWRDGAKEKQRIVQAIRRALENHPVFTMRVDRNGMHYPDQLVDIERGKYHRFYLLEDAEDVLIQLELSRILGDGRSGKILFEDIERAYNGLPLEQDDYWGYVARYEQQKTEAHYANSRDWLINEFADESVPVRPTIDRRWLMTLLPPKAGLFEDDYSAMHEKIERLKEERFISYEGIFSLCVALAIVEYCGTDEAALTWAYEGRELPEEQRIFGSLHRDIPFQIRKSRIEKRESAIRLARTQIRQGIAHSDYPYTLTAPYTDRWNYAVNVLRAVDPEELLRSMSLPIIVESIPEPKYAYALLDVEIHERAEALQLVYRYSATHYKTEAIRKFADLVRKYVEWLID